MRNATSFDAYLSRREDEAMREPDGECPVCGHDAWRIEYEDRGWCDDCHAAKLDRRALRRAHLRVRRPVARRARG